MAIKALQFYSVILRPFVSQRITARGWEYLLLRADRQRNFDGEIMVFGAMSPSDHEEIINQLISFGYIRPERGNKSDMYVSYYLDVGPQLPDWLELVDVKFFDETIPSSKAWKMKNSNVYELLDFEKVNALPTKGYECDWQPFIGQIR